jgi:hypothetical protein
MLKWVRRGKITKEVGQADEQIWTQQNCRIDLEFSLTTNNVSSEGEL